MAELEQERTEQATPKKRQQERKKGNVARSQDVVAALGLVVATVVLLSTSRSDATYAMEYMRASLAGGFEINSNEFAFAAKTSTLILTILRRLAVLFFLLFFAAVLGNILQTGFIFLPKKALPDITRLSPNKNLRKLFSKTSAIQVVGGIVKMFLFVALVASVIKHNAQTFANLPFGGPVEIVDFFTKIVSRTACQLCALTVVLAIVDYALKRWKYEQNLRMTQQELRDEIKEESGSPQAKGRRRDARRTLMNSVGAISGAAPAAPVSAFRSNPQERRSEKNKKARQ